MSRADDRAAIRAAGSYVATLVRARREAVQAALADYLDQPAAEANGSATIGGTDPAKGGGKIATSFRPSKAPTRHRRCR